MSDQVCSSTACAEMAAAFEKLKLENEALKLENGEQAIEISKIRRDWIVYAFTTPDGQPKYVGSTTSSLPDFAGYIRSSLNGSSKVCFLKNSYPFFCFQGSGEKYLSFAEMLKGDGLRLVILFSDLTNDEARLYETALIEVLTEKCKHLQ
jgi:hypothetical protein